MESYITRSRGNLILNPSFKTLWYINPTQEDGIISNMTFFSLQGHT